MNIGRNVARQIHSYKDRQKNRKTDSCVVPNTQRFQRKLFIGTTRNSSSIFFFTSFFLLLLSFSISLLHQTKTTCRNRFFFIFYCSLFVVVQVSTFLQSCSTTNSVVFVPINSVPLNLLCLDLVLELQQSFLFQSFDKWVWRWVVASFSKMGVEVGSRILQ